MMHRGMQYRNSGSENCDYWVQLQGSGLREFMDRFGMTVVRGP